MIAGCPDNVSRAMDPPPQQPPDGRRVECRGTCFETCATQSHGAPSCLCPPISLSTVALASWLFPADRECARRTGCNTALRYERLGCATCTLWGLLEGWSQQSLGALWAMRHAVYITVRTALGPMRLQCSCTPHPLFLTQRSDRWHYSQRMRTAHQIALLLLNSDSVSATAKWGFAGTVAGFHALKYTHLMVRAALRLRPPGPPLCRSPAALIFSLDPAPPIRSGTAISNWNCDPAVLTCQIYNDCVLEEPVPPRGSSAGPVRAAVGGNSLKDQFDLEAAGSGERCCHCANRPCLRQSPTEKTSSGYVYTMGMVTVLPVPRCGTNGSGPCELTQARDSRADGANAKCPFLNQDCMGALQQLIQDTILLPHSFSPSSATMHTVSTSLVPAGRVDGVVVIRCVVRVHDAACPAIQPHLRKCRGKRAMYKGAARGAAVGAARASTQEQRSPPEAAAAAAAAARAAAGAGLAEWG